ncbi:MAG: hypothetical protein MUE70_08950 [Desulfobacterales bacterium]|jgi:hypothetical protein|nr:hypothetical protein [Desulfobacterales bacterium]
MDLYNKKDFPKAFQSFSALANKGYDKAEFMLGKMYSNGDGIAAYQGDAKAQYFLSEMYYFGKCVPQNFVYSYVWSNIAVAQGIQDNLNIRNSASKMLSSHQLAEAQNIAIELKNKIDNQNNLSRKQSAPPNISDTKKSQIKSFGSGFIITTDGYLSPCWMQKPYLKQPAVCHRMSTMQ